MFLDNFVHFLLLVSEQFHFYLSEYQSYLKYFIFFQDNLTELERYKSLYEQVLNHNVNLQVKYMNDICELFFGQFCPFSCVSFRGEFVFGQFCPLSCISFSW